MIDYITRLIMTENRGRWFCRHLLDLAIVVLPMLRPLRLMRFLTVLALIGRNTGNMLRGRVVIYTVGATVLTVFIASLAVFDAERGIGDIETFPDAVWWPSSPSPPWVMETSTRSPRPEESPRWHSWSADSP